MGEVMKEAFFSLAKATFAAGDFNRTVFENANTKAAVTVKAKTDNVAGVKLPVFEYADTGADSMLPASLPPMQRLSPTRRLTLIVLLPNIELLFILLSPVDSLSLSLSSSFSLVFSHTSTHSHCLSPIIELLLSLRGPLLPVLDRPRSE